MREAAISPDGEYIAFAPGGNRKLWVQNLDQRTPRAIEETEGARNPFWSPDSSFIGFAAAGELKKVPVQGGEVNRICQTPASNVFGGTWSRDRDSIVFSSGHPVAQLYEVSANGVRRFERLPRLTVQLPLYNEMYVAERLIDAVCTLDYPRDRLEIQVLDGRIRVPDDVDVELRVAAKRVDRILQGNQ